MFSRLATRLPRTLITTRTTTPAFRSNSSSSSSSSAARVLEMAARAERPSNAEVAVPLLWAVCAGLSFTAWNRQSEGVGADVESLIVV
ncbi:hypothetical protein BDW02DRAFT_572025 [Decorospora gaudefroyi]|uniref:Uncharacterized protein n=1 Tax=Decorospora gaudefroyi TaxID=184978 RepID=A0A6A5KAF0_9PLEO|nr:hypothetical protein BDW02DRAFT_572025 [Decorospora gaudefroyi]